MRRDRLLAAVMVALAGTVGLVRAAEPGPDECEGRGTSLLIAADDHRLYLCKDGRVELKFPVSLGRGGVDKRQAGDHRTPLGVYPLGSPRASNTYHLFIPIGYPTAAQKKEGRTGRDVGIHGPHRKWKWLGRLLDVRDWTRGCVAVNRDAYIEAVARFVRDSRVKQVEIVP